MTSEVTSRPGSPVPPFERTEEKNPTEEKVRTLSGRLISLEESKKNPDRQELYFTKRLSNPNLLKEWQQRKLSDHE